MDKTCCMCHSREGVALSTANRWFCQSCLDSLPYIDEDADEESEEEL